MLQRELRGLARIVRNDHGIYDHTFNLEWHITIKRSAAEVLGAVFERSVGSEDWNTVAMRQSRNARDVVTVFMADQNSREISRTELQASQTLLRLLQSKTAIH